MRLNNFQASCAPSNCHLHDIITSPIDTYHFATQRICENEMGAAGTDLGITHILANHSLSRHLNQANMLRHLLSSDTLKSCI